MSRIHDALARAQQQRTEVQPTQGEAAAGELGMPSLELCPPPEGEAVDSDGWLANCAQATWTLDPVRMIFVSDRPQSSYGRELFRTLRSRLFKARHSAPLKRILVASALPGEGRSFIAANLAQALAQQHGSRVALIDADLRSPSLHGYLGAPPAPGISEYLRGEASEAAVVQQSNIEGLWFVPAGGVRENPVELLGSPRMPQFFERLSPCFDWMVVDSSPAIPVSDATLVARLCDGVVLVVAAALTRQEMASKTRAMLEDRTLLGVVLNRADGSFNGRDLSAGG
jgi:capsular exopolysaccharide synthesis family protein